MLGMLAWQGVLQAFYIKAVSYEKIEFLINVHEQGEYFCEKRDKTSKIYIVLPNNACFETQYSIFW